jgi:hypothetical protein
MKSIKYVNHDLLNGATGKLQSKLPSANCRLPTLFIILFILIATASQAQRISFCEKVDEKGNPVNASKTFSINKKGGFLSFHVTLPAEVGHPSVTYDLFLVDSLGTEHYDNTFRQAVEPTNMIFWKQIDFYHPGKYRVYVYDDFDKFLCAGELTVVMK